MKKLNQIQELEIDKIINRLPQLKIMLPKSYKQIKKIADTQIYNITRSKKDNVYLPYIIFNKNIEHFYRQEIEQIK